MDGEDGRTRRMNAVEFRRLNMGADSLIRLSSPLLIFAPLHHLGLNKAKLRLSLLLLLSALRNQARLFICLVAVRLGL